MAVVVTPITTEISDCDSSDWSSGAVNTDFPREGTGCLGLKVSSTLSAVAKYDQAPTGVDMTGEHFLVWAMSLSTIDTVALGGFRMYAEDTAGEWVEWYVGGSDNYGGGWQCFIVSADNTSAVGNSSAGTYDPSIHRYFGVRFKTVAKSNANNVFWDYARYGSGLRITTTSATVATFDDIISADDAAAVGMMYRSSGSVIIQAPELYFGNAGSAADCEFSDASEIVLWADAPVADYTLTVEGNSGTDTIKFQLGILSGGSGISGCYCKALGTIKPDIIATDTDIDEVKLYGTTFYDFDSIALPPTATGRESIDCIFESCGEILPDTCKVTGFKIVSPNDRGIRISSTSHQVTSGQIVGAGDGVNVTLSGTTSINLSAIIFVNCTYDLEWSGAAAGTLTVNNQNGADTSTYEITGGGTTVTILSPTVITFTDFVADTEIRVYLDSTGAEVFGVESATTPTEVANLQALTDYNIVAILPGWEEIRKEEISFAANQNYSLQQKEDRNFENPA